MTDATASIVKRVLPKILWVAAVVFVVVAEGGVGGADAPAALDDNSVAIKTSTAAAVVRIHKRAGESVTAGDVVVELDPSAIELEIAVAAAELERLKSEVLARGVELEGDAFESGTRLELESERAASELLTLDATLKRDDAEAVALDEQLQKQDELVAKHLASAAQRDELALRRTVVGERQREGKAAIAQARVRAAGAKARLDAWKKSRGGDGDVRTAPAQAAVLAQQERLKLLVARKEALRLPAPVAGTLQSVVAVVGGHLDANAVAFVVTPQEGLTATAWVDELHTDTVKVGDHAELVATDGRLKPLSGVVRALGPSVSALPERFWQLAGEPMYGRAVYIDVEGEVRGALPGQRFDVRFEAARPPREQAPR